MIFRYGDLMQQPRSPQRPLVITTNGTVKKDGEAVMGRGIVRSARDGAPGFAAWLGALIQRYGNRPFQVTSEIWTLPVKHHWREAAELELIATSLKQLGLMVARFGEPTLMIPRPGCGNGKLSWAQVSPVMEQTTAQWPVEPEVWTFESAFK